MTPELYVLGALIAGLTVGLVSAAVGTAVESIRRS